jgi:hypothetical protein
LRMVERKKTGWIKRTLLIIASFLLAGAIVVGVFVPMNPFRSIARTIGFAVSGRLHYPVDRLGQVIADERGKPYAVFREVVVDPAPEQPRFPGAVLTIELKVTNMSPAMNRFYSGLPLPLYMGDPGFRSKVFTIDGQDCRSIYEWDTEEEARDYVGSIALKTILARAVPGSVSWKISLR